MDKAEAYERTKVFVGSQYIPSLEGQNKTYTFHGISNIWHVRDYCNRNRMCHVWKENFLSFSLSLFSLFSLSPSSPSSPSCLSVRSSCDACFLGVHYCVTSVFDRLIMMDFECELLAIQRLKNNELQAKSFGLGEG